MRAHIPNPHPHPLTAAHRHLQKSWTFHIRSLTKLEFLILRIHYVNQDVVNIIYYILIYMICVYIILINDYDTPEIYMICVYIIFINDYDTPEIYMICIYISFINDYDTPSEVWMITE